jgi:hypothetical protein
LTSRGVGSNRFISGQTAEYEIHKPMENKAATNFHIWVWREHPMSLENKIRRTMSSPDKQEFLTTRMRRVAYSTVLHVY